MGTLSIWIGHKERELYYVDDFFNACFKSEWFSSQLAKDIMRDIDGIIEVDGDRLVLIDDNTGREKPIAPQQLCSGTKALLIMLNTDEEYVCLSRCGDNCIKYFFEILKLKDLKITINNSFPPVDDFSFYCENDKTWYHSYEDFLFCVVEYSNSYQESETELFNDTIDMSLFED